MRNFPSNLRAEWLMLSVTVLTAAPSFAEGDDAQLNALMAQFPGWSLVEQAKGDLNADKKPDIALILKRPEEAKGNRDAGVQALLVIALSDAAGRFQVHTQAPKAICVGCGGPRAIMGEPLGVPKITAAGVLHIELEGGSREAWSDVLRWRLDRKKGHFLLIGRTYTVVDTIGETPETKFDANFSTLKAERFVGKKKTRCTLPASVQETTLDMFDYHESDISQTIEKCR